MSDSQDVTTDDAEAPEAAAEATAGEPVDDGPGMQDPVAEETGAQEPVAEESAAEPSEDEPVAEEPVAEDDGESEGSAEAETPATVAEPFGPVRVARVYVCERAHRTATLWGAPATCQARPLRSGPECGLPLYHITELPEQIQKALNPLKASKKASKKK